MFIKTLTGKTITVTSPGTMTVDQLKDMIAPFEAEAARQPIPAECTVS